MRWVPMPISSCVRPSAISMVSTMLGRSREPRASLRNAAAVLRHTLGVCPNIASISMLHPLGTSNSDPRSDVGQWHEAALKRWGVVGGSILVSESG